MALGTSLVNDTGAGEQIVRRPRSTDAIGAALREAFSGTTPLPADIIRSLTTLDRCRSVIH